MAIQTSFAQTFSKGDTFVEGTVKFVSSDDTKTFNFNPTVGHFVTDKVAVGLSVNTEKTTDDLDATKNVDSFGFGVFARCYFLRIGEHLNIHSQLGVNSDKAGDTKTLGANYFVTKNLSLTLSVADLASYKSVKGGDNTTTIGFSGVTNPFTTPSFGVNYRF